MAALTASEMSFSRIAQELNALPVVALGVTGYPLSYLCTHDNINMFSLKKPRNNGGLFPTDAYWGTIDAASITIPDFEVPIDTSLNWSHKKPTGGESSPYRLNDFLGYDHYATPCIHSGCTASVDVNMAYESLRSKVFSFDASALGSDSSLSVYDIDAIQNLYFAVAFLTSLTATSGPILTCADTIGEGGTSIVMDLFDLNLSGTYNYKYLYFFLCGAKSTQVAPYIYNISDLQINEMQQSKVIYHNDTYLNPVPISVYNDTMLEMSSSGIAPDGYTSYAPYANYSTTAYVSTGMDSIKFSVTNNSPVDINNIAQLDVYAVSFWGTEELCAHYSIYSGSSIASYFSLESGETKEYTLTGCLFTSKDGNYYDLPTATDLIPTDTISTYIKIKYNGETLFQSATFKARLEVF